MLKELKESTEEEHTDYKDIVTAFESVSELALHINSTKKKHGEQMILRRIAIKLKGNLGPLRESFILGKNVEHKWKVNSNKTSKKCDHCTEMIGVSTLNKCVNCSIHVHESCLRFVLPNCTESENNTNSDISLITPTRVFIKKGKMMHKFLDMEKLSKKKIQF